MSEFAIEPLGPEMPAAAGIDELGCDAHAIAGLADAPLEHKTHAQVAPDLLHFGRPALVDEGGVARDDEQARDLREIGDQVLGQAIAEILLLDIATHVREGQHGDRRLVRHGRRRCGLTRARSSSRRPDAENPYRLGDVLERPFAQILQHDLRLVADKIAYGARDVDRSRFRDALQTCGHIHPIAVDISFVCNHVAQIDSDAEFYSVLLGQVRIPIDHPMLHFDGAAYRLDRTGELDQHTVARRLHDAPAVFGDLRVNELTSMRLEPLKGALFVGAHQT
jgi:hypothetical protein